MKKLIIALMLMSTLALSTVVAHAATRDEQRAEIQKMKSSVLDRLYKADSLARKRVSNAAGYAVFSSADLAAIFFSGSYGHGVAHDNRSGQETYMQMASAGVGLGLGVKDFNLVFVFKDAKAYENFVMNGLDLSGHVDLAAKQGTKGAALTGQQDVLPGVTVYQMTKTGLMGQVMLKGTKYWRDSALNGERTSSRLNYSDRKVYNR